MSKSSKHRPWARHHGKIGAHTLHSRQSSHETTRKAREAFLARFEAEVDPDGILEPEERRRRAMHARRAYFARLALRSAQKRARRQEGGAE